VTRVYVSETENTIWTEEKNLSLYERHMLERNHILVPWLIGIMLVLGLAAGHWNRFEEPADLNTLLQTRSCEGCDLSWTNFAGAHLSGVNLRHANLKGADFSVADLSRADLRDTNLSGASLYHANLSGADLRGADVSGALFVLANLSGATWKDGTLCKVVPKR
jgi:uncharacterized protein YjbI with pentapeptide repeats